MKSPKFCMHTRVSEMARICFRFHQNSCYHKIRFVSLRPTIFLPKNRMKKEIHQNDVSSYFSVIDPLKWPAGPIWVWTSPIPHSTSYHRTRTVKNQICNRRINHMNSAHFHAHRSEWDNMHTFNFIKIAARTTIQFGVTKSNIVRPKRKKKKEQ